VVNDKGERAALAERWRVAGRDLTIADPIAFMALLYGAEISIASSPEMHEEISLVDIVS